MGFIRSELMPFAAMVGLESVFVGVSTLTKAAVLKGMSPYIFVFYSSAFGTLLISPFSYLFDRNKSVAALSVSLLCKFFFMSLIGITLPQNLMSVAVGYSSPTLSSAMMNLIPAFTFLLAVIFRMEKLNWRSSTAQIKIMGTLLSISGALVVVFCNGQSIHGYASASVEINWIIGGLLYALASLCISLWIILQEDIIRAYPAQLSVAAFYLLFASIQCGVICCVTERNNTDPWTLMPDISIKLIATIFTAVFGNIGFCYVKVWCIQQKGPVFVSLFKPLGVAIAAFLTFLLFGEKLHLGMVVGAAIIVIGFYGVLWAKSKENKEEGDSNKLPLLQNDKFSHVKCELQ